MVDIDLPEFLLALARLCAGFDTPVTEARKDAYWQSLRKLTLREFERLVNAALSGDFLKMPTTGALWKMQRESFSAAPTPVSEGPSIHAQLVEYAKHKLSHRLKAGTLAYAMTYLHRPDGECVGVVIDLDANTRIGFRVGDMLADVEGHAYALRRFKPGPRPAQQLGLPDLSAP